METRRQHTNGGKPEIKAPLTQSRGIHLLPRRGGPHDGAHVSSRYRIEANKTASDVMSKQRATEGRSNGLQSFSSAVTRPRCTCFTDCCTVSGGQCSPSSASLFYFPSFSLHLRVVGVGKEKEAEKNSTAFAFPPQFRLSRVSMFDHFSEMAGNRNRILSSFSSSKLEFTTFDYF